MHLTGVGRRYGALGPWVLRGVDLDVPPGTLMRVSGANGSGKSTLLRLLAGIDAPSEGRVTGRPRTAYVPERFPSSLPFTALGYLTHLGRVHGLRSAVATERARAWLERFGAAGHARTPLRELSKGTSQKVAVAQALLAEPELLILDEAWTGLDVDARAELDRTVGELTASGVAVVYVDHDPRRLAGAVDAAYRVEGAALLPDTGQVHEPAPRVTIVARGRAGAPLPAGLPEDARAELDAAGGATVTVPAAHSDTVLRALLRAEPPWHIRAVREPEAEPSPLSYADLSYVERGAEDR
ncbi:ATP-binding cassette domain-containing protein [Streptomyces boluensis]|uniref:ATP-binding cassette domain-containing protein n=1 Tax=Streptomyces boluensis TaxID=1775135 RepID=A0A964UN53_9ACTN|nr:ATP-binding cassette domain-containing protein [Streptomyces boluensis]NBE51687.1 ATP-binding cassette domain-containing protein [Streptomyces boluensis]